MEIAAEEIASTCHKTYESLPAKFKPKSGQWTVLSGIVKDKNGILETVALATGTKCISSSKMRSDGSVVNDAHAEILARRAFLRYLYDQMEHKVNGEHDDGIFEFSNEENERRSFVICPDVKFHFFSTKPPCGDASIVYEETALVHNTGAKLMKSNNDIDDKLDPELGSVRRKPGRGEVTLSVSCSDKLARWTEVGIQGALIDMLLREPIYLNSVIIGGDGPISLKSIRRALNRTKRQIDVPIVKESKIKFEYCESLESTPCYESVVWCKVDQRPLEIIVEGKKLGATKNNAKQSLLSISRKLLFRRFIEIYKELFFEKKQTFDKETYGNFKEKSCRYYNRWNEIKEIHFRGWPEKKCYHDFYAF